jgi:hypothetical protein
MFGYQDLKNKGMIGKSIKFQDVRLGIPVHIYYLDNDKLRDFPESTSVKTFINPLNNWEIPVYTEGICACFLTAYLADGQVWKFSEVFIGGMVTAWNKVRKIWPENEGVIPVIINWGNCRMMHFPQKNSHNLTFLPGIVLSNADSADNDVAALGDSRSILPKLNKERINYEKKRAKHCLDCQDQNNGGNNE